MNKARRIGLFGGTFDPIHNAHIEIARAAVGAARLDVVYFVVSARPPHKQTVTHASPEQRLEMVRAAVEGEQHFEPSDVEVVREGYSYTVETLREYRRRHPGAEVFLIVGYDSLLDLPQWHKFGEILEQCRLLVVPRAGMKQEPAPELAGFYDMLPFKETKLSSTEIRRRIEAGQPITGLAPPAVERMIHEKGIYRNANRRQPAC